MQQIDRKQADKNECIEMINFYKPLSEKLTASNEERTTALQMLNIYRARAKQLQLDIELLYNSLNKTLTDRADLTHTAIIQLLENEKTPAEITTTVIAKYGKHTADELTAEERTQAQEQANFRKVINAVGKAISELSSPDALTSTKTKCTKATAQEVEQWYKLYGGTGKNIKIPQPIKRARLSDCYATMEHRNTKTQQGYYKIMHYITVAPYQYIEQYTAENGEVLISGYEKSYNPFVSNRADLDRLADLYNRANLNDRQRLFIKYFCQRARLTANFDECKKYAFSKIGIDTDDNRRQFFHRLKQALKTAIK